MMRFVYRANPLRDFLRLPYDTLFVMLFCGCQQSSHQAQYSLFCLSKHGTQFLVSHEPKPLRLFSCLCVLPVFDNVVRKMCAWFDLLPRRILLSPLSFACCHGSCASFFFTCTLIISRAYTCPRCEMRCIWKHFHVNTNFCK